MAGFIVTTLVDENTAGASVAAPGGTGLSLREALALANGNGATPDTITFAAGLSGGTLILTNGQLGITTDQITVNGDIDGNGTPGVTISGDADHSGTHNAGDSGVFDISGGAASATLNGLVIQDGWASSGGGISVGQNAGLTLTNSVLANNQASDRGGGLYNGGTAILRNVVMSDNNGTAFTAGGGIWNGQDGLLSLTDVIVTGSDTGGEGGGINNRGIAVLTNVTLSGNGASGVGGGIFNNGTLTLSDTTLADNRSTLSGGGLYNAGGTAGLTNTTLWGNTTFSDGGAIFNAASGVVRLTNSTVTGNSAEDAGGGIHNVAGATATLANSIVAGNAAGSSGADIQNGGTLDLAGGNIVGETFTQDGGSPVAGIALDDIFDSVISVDPDGFGGNPDFDAGALANNGGPVKTVALNHDAANPAMDSGDPDLLDETQAGTPDLNGDGDQLDIIAIDARGFDRDADSAGGTPDLGAFEIPNASPVLDHALADQNFAVNHAFDFSQSSNSFSDPDFDPLTYTATLQNGGPLPAWVHFDAGTLHFFGTPATNFVGDLDIKVVAGDGSLSASDHFLLSFTNSGNDLFVSGTGTGSTDSDPNIFPLAGGPGNDTYLIADDQAQVSENSGAGTDTVYTTVTYTMSANVEGMVLQESGGTIDGSGGGDNDTIIGNSFANTLSGGGGTDALVGGGGDDLLIGGAGDDGMAGGGGNDTYAVDSTNDQIAENAGEGTDTVYATANFGLFANVEGLVLVEGAGAINGTGNGGDNYIFGNASANTLNGLGGNDVLSGAGGADILIGDAGDDVLTGGTDNDIFAFAPGFGHDAITDFTTADHIVFDQSLFASYAAVQSRTVEIDADTTAILFDAANTLVIDHAAGVALTQNDFLFS